MVATEHFPKIEDYGQYVGAETVERITKKAKNLRDAHVVHVNATYYGGGVAELLGSLTLLMNTLGIKTGWRVIQGSPDFFGVTKKIHNALQDGDINITDRKLRPLAGAEVPRGTVSVLSCSTHLRLFTGCIGLRIT